MSRVRWILVACLVCAASMRPTFGQEPNADDRRARLEAMSEAERAKFLQFVERMKALPEAERSALRRRAKHLDSMRRRVYADLDPKTRARIDSLSPERRRAILKDMVREEADESGQRLLKSLPEPMRKRLEEATPADRERYLKDFRRRGMDRGIAKIGLEMGVAQAELEVWKSQPEDARRARFLDLMQSRILSAAKVEDLPKGIDENLWKRIAGMSAPDFMHTFRRLVRSHPELEAWAGRGSLRAPEERGRGRHSSQRGKLNGGAVRLTRALRVSAEERLKLAELPEAQRIAKQDLMRREAATRVIREERMLAADEVAKMESLSDKAFFDLVRAKLLGWRKNSGRRREFRRHPKRWPAREGR